jgi:hypothetical protein
MRATFCLFVFAILATFVAIDLAFKIYFFFGIKAPETAFWKEKSELWPALMQAIGEEALVRREKAICLGMSMLGMLAIIPKPNLRQQWFLKRCPFLI